jgi:hypothetical protein
MWDIPQSLQSHIGLSANEGDQDERGLMSEPLEQPLHEDQIQEMLNSQIAAMKKRGDLKLAIIPEGRCRVCQDEGSRKLVNRLLAHGLGYAEIVSLLEPINRARRKNNKISYNSVFHHAKKHFSIQEPAQALYRTILDSRAKEIEEDFAAGVGHHINHLSYLETMMVKGYAELTSEERNVSVEMGKDAAIRLAKFMKEDEGAQKTAEQMQQINRIIQVVKEVVPDKYFPMILAKLEDPNADKPSLTVESDVEVEEVDPESDYDERDVFDDE